MKKKKNNIIELVLCLLFGWAGAHKFYNKKRGLGILYLLTFGLLCIGWWGDAAALCMDLFFKSKNSNTKKPPKAAGYAIAAAFVLLLGSCGGPKENDQVEPTTEPTRVTETTDATTEPSVDDTTEATTPSTEPAAPETTESTEPAPTTPATEPVTEPESEPTTEPTTTPTVETSEPPVEATTESTTSLEQEEQSEAHTYILNTNTHVFHEEGCRGTKNMSEDNKLVMTATREEVIAMDYEPCGICHP